MLCHELPPGGRGEQAADLVEEGSYGNHREVVGAKSGRCILGAVARNRQVSKTFEKFSTTCGEL